MVAKEVRLNENGTDKTKNPLPLVGCGFDDQNGGERVRYVLQS